MDDAWSHTHGGRISTKIILCTTKTPTESKPPVETGLSGRDLSVSLFFPKGSTFRLGNEKKQGNSCDPTIKKKYTSQSHQWSLRAFQSGSSTAPPRSTPPSSFGSGTIQSCPHRCSGVVRTGTAARSRLSLNRPSMFVIGQQNMEGDRSEGEK